jgi:hypothetical protein
MFHLANLCVSRRTAPNGKRHSLRLASSPYFFVGPRPYREARLRSYIVREHRRGRPLEEILDDPYLERHGTPSLIWRVVTHPRTIAALRADVADEIRDDAP